MPLFPKVDGADTTTLIESPTYKSETWEYNQAQHTRFAFTGNGGCTFTTVTLSQPQRGDETLHGTTEDCATIVAELADLPYEEAEKRILAHYHNGFQDIAAEDSIDPIAFFAEIAEDDREVAGLG